MISTRAFFAHPASMQEDDIWDACIDIRDFIATKQGADTSDHIRVVSGRDDFQKNAHGDWDAWQAGVVIRQDFMTGKPVYDLFITTGDTCGKATASILKMALLEKKPVFNWTDGALERIDDIVVDDPEDWATGYRIVPIQLQLFEIQS
mgnify:CR=1 FL=1